MIKLLPLLILAGCAPITALPDGAERFVPPPSWGAHRAAMVACAGIDSAGPIVWYVAPDGSLGPGVLARWDYPHRITLTAFVAEAELAATIRHELLHDLWARDVPPDAPHPPVFATCGV